MVLTQHRLSFHCPPLCIVPENRCLPQKWAFAMQNWLQIKAWSPQKCFNFLLSFASLMVQWVTFHKNKEYIHHICWTTMYIPCQYPHGYHHFEVLLLLLIYLLSFHHSLIDSHRYICTIMFRTAHRWVLLFYITFHTAHQWGPLFLISIYSISIVLYIWNVYCSLQYIIHTVSG